MSAFRSPMRNLVGQPCWKPSFRLTRPVEAGAARPGPPHLGETGPPLRGVRREVIFLIDTSEVVGGATFRGCKQVLLQHLQGLGTDDLFNIVEFNSAVFRLFHGSRSADRPNLNAARRFVDILRPGGPRRLAVALRTAMASYTGPSSRRELVLVTGPAEGGTPSRVGIGYETVG